MREILTKEHMKKIIGGDEGTIGHIDDGTTCRIKSRDASVANNQWFENNYYHAATMSCADQSAYMNNVCLNLISQYPNAECRYDCGCDGWGT